MVNATKLNELLQHVETVKSPATYLLNGAIDLIFSKTELAESRGIGARKRSRDAALDATKVAACKGSFILLLYFLKFCIHLYGKQCKSMRSFRSIILLLLLSDIHSTTKKDVTSDLIQRGTVKEVSLESINLRKDRRKK